MLAYTKIISTLRSYLLPSIQKDRGIRVEVFMNLKYVVQQYT